MKECRFGRAYRCQRVAAVDEFVQDVTRQSHTLLVYNFYPVNLMPYGRVKVDNYVGVPHQ